MRAGSPRQVRAHEQEVAGAEQGRDPAEERRPRPRLQVADRAAQEGHQAPPARARRDGGEMALEVARDPVDGEARVGLGQASRGRQEGLGADIERDVAPGRSAGPDRVDQHGRLAGRAGSELHQLVDAVPGDDPRRRAAQDPQLGAGLVVLGEPGDLLEQLRAARVVEVLRGHALGSGREAGARVGGQRRDRSWVDVQPVRERRRERLRAHGAPPSPRSHARRRPAKIWRRSGRSQFRKVGRTAIGWVAHEPPRSTRYPRSKNGSAYSR